MDPNLLSIHLEEGSRREDFRRARGMLQQCVGEHTLNGDLVESLDAAGREEATFLKGHQPLATQTKARSFVLIDRGHTVLLRPGVNTIGRLPDNHVVIDDASVSRRHCAIVVHSDMRCEIYDIASKNGTGVNGQRISGPHWLQAGDMIQLSERTLCFKEIVEKGDPSSQVLTAPPPEPAPPTPALGMFDEPTQADMK
jgi:hypothetical protein